VPPEDVIEQAQGGLSHTISEHPKWFIKKVWKEHAKQHQKPHNPTRVADLPSAVGTRR
jgi:hypothetical protein